MLRRNPIIFILFFMLTGCAINHVQLVDPIAREIPKPHYVLSGISTPITVLFYYTAFEEIRDVDGTVIAKPTYLDFLDHQTIYTGKIKAVTLTLEINNPKGITYSLWEEMKVNEKKVGEVQSGRYLNRSNQKYRQFVYRLPLGGDVRDVEQCVRLMVDQNEVMRIGYFQYHLIH